MSKIALRRGGTSNIIRVFLQDTTSATGGGKTGLTFSSSGLIISTIADVEATATTYTAAGSTIETITTIGTYAAPTATKCRFKEIDATNFPGVYEIQIADARFSVANSTQLLVSIQCTGVSPVFAEYQFVLVDLLDSVRLGLTALPNVASGSAGAIITSGTGTAQLSVSSGAVTVGTINSGAATTVENAVWDATMSSHTGSTTYGGRVIRAVNSNVTAFLTGSNHIAADVHELQPGVISDADYEAGSTYDKLSTLIEADPVSGYRYTMQALEQAPAAATTVRMGPFQIKADGGGADTPLDIQKGATHGIDCTLVDWTGASVDITGTTLTAKIYNSAGALVESPAGTITYAAGGQLTWTITTTTTNTAGTYTATITRTTGASDTQVFGPLRIYVREV